MFLPVISNPRDCFCSLPISPPPLLISSDVSFCLWWVPRSPSEASAIISGENAVTVTVRNDVQDHLHQRKTAALVACSNTENNSCASLPDSGALAVSTAITVCIEELICTTSSWLMVGKHVALSQECFGPTVKAGLFSRAYLLGPMTKLIYHYNDNHCNKNDSLQFNFT